MRKRDQRRPWVVVVTNIEGAVIRTRHTPRTVRAGDVFASGDAKYRVTVPDARASKRAGWWPAGQAYPAHPMHAVLVRL